jgi:predicted DNA binding protein
MPTIVSGRIPAADFLLADAMRAAPSLRYEVEPVVESGSEAQMPLLKVRGDAGEDVVSLLRDDPTVGDATPLRTDGRERLVQVSWAETTDLLVEMLTNSHATILDAVGHDGTWELRVLYPDRALFSKTHEFCEDHGLEFAVESIRGLDEDAVGRYDLTARQFEVLEAAARHGYFDVPREVNLQELADELDVSHQALSERLRRGTSSLIDESLHVG